MNKFMKLRNIIRLNEDFYNGVGSDGKVSQLIPLKKG